MVLVLDTDTLVVDSYAIFLIKEKWLAFIKNSFSWTAFSILLSVHCIKGSRYFHNLMFPLNKRNMAITLIPNLSSRQIDTLEYFQLSIFY